MSSELSRERQEKRLWRHLCAIFNTEFILMHSAILHFIRKKLKKWAYWYEIRDSFTCNFEFNSAWFICEMVLIKLSLNLKFTIRRCHEFFEIWGDYSKIYMKSHSLEIVACCTIQVSFERQNETSNETVRQCLYGKSRYKKQT